MLPGKKFYSHVGFCLEACLMHRNKKGVLGDLSTLQSRHGGERGGTKEALMI